MNPADIARRIPTKVREAVYVALGVVSAVQLVFAPFPADTWGRVLSFLGVLGFSVAKSNVGDA